MRILFTLLKDNKNDIIKEKREKKEEEKREKERIKKGVNINNEIARLGQNQTEY